MLTTFIFMYLIIAFRYLAISWAIDYCGRNRKFGFRNISFEAKAKTIRNSEIKYSLLSSLWFTISGLLVFHLIETGKAQVFWGFGAKNIFLIFLTLFIYLFIHDTWFYFSHRLLHTKYLFKKMHAVHHQSIHPTSYAALSFNTAEAVFESTFVPIMIYFVPIHGIALLILLAIMTFFGSLNHSAYEIFSKSFALSKIGKWILTPTHHLMHHERFQGNYSLYFTWWDRILKTQFKDYEARLL